MIIRNGSVLHYNRIENGKDIRIQARKLIGSKSSTTAGWAVSQMTEIEFLI
jgi:hypothetical protein